ncbi:hypothetical protein NA57DRAFT_55394 [Rhizodiscina lignyota]|uniref:FR47-like domain-containing protein n=1 Tax=Rhizodiscina lignyota TaxID=1504668 RepID=A0A9P4IHR2_9PEZI|nr:hypothetical protein NA57DRAFT_55394 [Rhizodiscina lignyota]
MSTSQVQHHPVDGFTIIPVLKAFLPRTLPLLRRAQFPHRSPSFYITATFSPGTAVESLPQCFAVCILDRSRRPETEGWLFSSGEIEGRCPELKNNTENSSGSGSTPQQCPDCTRAILSLAKHIPSLPLPDSVHGEDNITKLLTQSRSDQPSPGQTSAKQVSTLDYSRHITNPNVMVVGTIAQFPAEILNSQGLIRTDLPGMDIPYQKFIFRTSDLRHVDTTLPDGLRWGQVRPQDFELVRSRTAIPRKDKTLALLPSVAIFREENSGGDSPVAWGFLGPDGSLASLHVEPNYRGRGLAKKVTTKILNEQLKVFDEEEGKSEQGWICNSDVALDNLESTGVARSLGGRPGWVVYWVRVNLEKAKALP